MQQMGNATRGTTWSYFHTDSSNKYFFVYILVGGGSI